MYYNIDIRDRNKQTTTHTTTHTGVINNMNIDKFNELTQDLEFVSPYKAASIVSVVCEKHVREQMIYNYVKKNYIASSRNNLGKLQIAIQDLRTFVEIYSKNSDSKTSKYSN
jgi:Glu-tRNA(Gln) amidotransferase subunit E-like FAD-binding protein